MIRSYNHSELGVQNLYTHPSRASVDHFLILVLLASFVEDKIWHLKNHASDHLISNS